MAEPLFRFPQILLGSARNDVIDKRNSFEKWLILADDGNDGVWGSAQNDTIEGGRGQDTIVAGAGSDSVLGGADNDRIWGEAGNDILAGGDGNDTLYGGDGHDEIAGDNGVDVIFGGEGYDYINGGFGDDILFGGDDNDSINAMFGFDFIDGGAGVDTVILNAGYDFATAVEIDLQAGTMITAGGMRSIANVENVYLTAKDDWISGADGENWLIGQGGDDWIYGAGGADVLSGDWGNDTLVGGAGNDRLYGNYNEQDHGADRFVTTTNALAGFDAIADYSAAEGDVLDVSGDGAGYRFVTDGSDGFVLLDATGNGVFHLQHYDIANGVILA